MFGIRLGPKILTRLRGVAGVGGGGFTPEQLFAVDPTFTSSTGWFTSPGATISGGVLTYNNTANTICRATFSEGDLVRAPVEGEYLVCEFDLVSYTEGNINPRIRYTDGTFAYFFGDRVGGSPLAGGDAVPGHWRSLSHLVPAGKTVDYVEFRVSIRNGSVNCVVDNFELLTSETAVDVAVRT